MKTPDGKNVRIVFASHQMKNTLERWWASVSFPAGTCGDGQLPVSATDWENRPLDKAVFECFGICIPIKNGKGSVSCADFIKGKHATAVWMHRDGMKPVPGSLTFA